MASACTFLSEPLSLGPAGSQGIVTATGSPWSLSAPRDFSKAAGFLAPMESLSMHSGAVEPLVVQAQGQGDHQESNKELLTHVWAKPASPSSSLLKFPSPTVSPASLCAAFIPFLPAKSRQCSAWLLQCLHSLRSPARLLCCLCLPAPPHGVGAQPSKWRG